MPQIWLDDEELGVLLGCGGREARERTRAEGWPRRRCSDGLTRAKLPPEATDDYMTTYVAGLDASRRTDQMVDQLRSVLRQAYGSTSLRGNRSVA